MNQILPSAAVILSLAAALLLPASLCRAESYRRYDGSVIVTAPPPMRSRITFEQRELGIVRDEGSRRYRMNPTYNEYRKAEGWAPPRGPVSSAAPFTVNFPDVYEGVIKAYLKTHTGKNGGGFLVKDEVTGRIHRLQYVGIANNETVQLSDERGFACLEFQSATGEKVDLDIYIKEKNWGEWEVSQVLLHKIGGEPRYVYDDQFRIVDPAAALAAKAQQEAAASGIPKPNKPPKLSVQVAFREPSGDNILEGGEGGVLIVSVFNAGPGQAYAVKLEPTLETKAELTLSGPLALGDIPAGQTVVGEVPVSAAANVSSGRVQVRLLAREHHGFDSDAVTVKFETKKFEPPELRLAGVAIGPGRVVKAGEPTKVTVGVRNDGKGPAEAVAVFLVVGSQHVFISGEPSASLGVLKPGQTKTAEFEFFVNKRFSGDKLPVSVSVSESRGKHGFPTTSLGLALGKSPPASKLVAFEGRHAAPAAAPAAEVEDVDQPPRAGTAKDPHAYAVLVGIEKYRDLPPVEFASRDAETLHSYLTRSMGFDTRNVVILQDERATLTDMATYLGPWLEDRVSDKSRVLIFFAGHGAPDPKTGEGYLVPYDGNPNYTGTKALAIKKLYADLAKLPAKDVTVVLDACFSGAGGRSVIAKGARPLVSMTAAPPPAANMTVLTAAEGDQISTYYPEARHGMLTYFLLKGLRGAADRDSDRKITTGELFEFLLPEVEREARKQHVEQTPTIRPVPAKLGEKGSRVWLNLK